MRRITLDALLTVAGIGIAIIFLIAGGLLTWGYNFTTSQVHNQLASQKIFFPVKGSPELASPQIGPYLNKYAGQQLLDGQQAEAWANHFIAVHLQTIGGGNTYSQLSAQALAQPNNVRLAAQVQTVFRGTALRGLLLNAYAFWRIGQIAGIAAIVSFAGAALMLILSIFGTVHLRRTAPQVEVLPGLAAYTKGEAT